MHYKIQKVTGGCHCEAIRYEAEVILERAYYCHCKDCHKNSGQPVAMGVPVRAGTLRFIKGDLKYYASSPWGERGFCPDCGSGIVWRPRDPSEAWLTNLNVGSLDAPEEVRPYMHIFTNRQLPWLKIDDELPRMRAEDMDRVVAAWKQERLHDH